jgi:hypothetical protein
LRVPWLLGAGTTEPEVLLAALGQGWEETMSGDRLVRMQLRKQIAKVLSPWDFKERCVCCGHRVQFPHLWRVPTKDGLSDPWCSACLGLEYMEGLAEKHLGKAAGL